jgi:hypothetical protein
MGCAMVPWVFVLISNDSGLCVGCFRGVGLGFGQRTETSSGCIQYIDYIPIILWLFQIYEKALIP